MLDNLADAFDLSYDPALDEPHGLGVTFDGTDDLVGTSGVPNNLIEPFAASLDPAARLGFPNGPAVFFDVPLHPLGTFDVQDDPVVFYDVLLALAGSFGVELFLAAALGPFDQLCHESLSSLQSLSFLAEPPVPLPDVVPAAW